MTHPLAGRPTRCVDGDDHLLNDPPVGWTTHSSAGRPTRQLDAPPSLDGDDHRLDEFVVEVDNLPNDWMEPSMNKTACPLARRRPPSARQPALRSDWKNDPNAMVISFSFFENQRTGMCISYLGAGVPRLVGRITHYYTAHLCVCVRVGLLFTVVRCTN